MAVFGEVVLFLLGLYILVYGALACFWAAGMSGDNKNLFALVIPICVGGGLIYLAIHYGPIVISIGT